MTRTIPNEAPVVEPPVIELTAVTRTYGSQPPVHALCDVDLTVRAGEWVAVIGPSGSGKSTLLNVLGCLDTPTTGTYRFAGVDVRSLSDKRRAGLRSRGIGFVFQSFHLLAHRTVRENVMLAEVYRRSGAAGRVDRAERALRQVGLLHRADFLPTTMSGGERQRAAIARALVGTPRVLLCDEPTGNLDSDTTEQVLEVITQLNAGGLAIVMITHEPDVAERAPRRVRIVDGRLTELS